MACILLCLPGYRKEELKNLGYKISDGFLYTNRYKFIIIDDSQIDPDQEGYIDCRTLNVFNALQFVERIISIANANENKNKNLIFTRIERMSLGPKQFIEFYKLAKSKFHGVENIKASKILNDIINIYFTISTTEYDIIVNLCLMEKNEKDYINRIKYWVTNYYSEERQNEKDEFIINQIESYICSSPLNEIVIYDIINNTNTPIVKETYFQKICKFLNLFTSK